MIRHQIDDVSHPVGAVDRLGLGRGVPPRSFRSDVLPSSRVSPTPGYAVSTTRQSAALRPAVNAGVAEYMPESPTIIAVPRLGRASGLDVGVVGVGAAGST